MREVSKKVAVITGGASGIGNGMARNFASAGMRIVIGDIEEEPLAAAVTDLEVGGAEVIGVPTDVSEIEDVRALRDAAIEKFGAVHVVCNNAGVGAGGAVWQTTIEDWQWVLGVNLWGVIHGILTFVPGMVEQGEGHVVNTASMAGLISGPGLSVYSASKYAVVAISESLAQDLQVAGSEVGVSVLCPGFVRTNIADSSRNRPAELSRTIELDAAAQSMMDLMKQVIDSGMDPLEVGALVLDSIREDRFYVLPHPELLGAVKSRFDGIAEGGAPTLNLGGLGAS